MRLDEVMRLVGPRAFEGRVSIEREVPQGLSLWADRRAFKQVLINLLSNAVKFTPEGGKVTFAPRSKAFMSIAIRDTGIGIPARHREAGAALRAGGEPVHQDQGRLGPRPRDLEVLRGTARRRMSIRSTVGQGTEVTVSFPVSAPQVQLAS
jgi:two-component system, cell cycle sensor histidine kinase PleC